MQSYLTYLCFLSILSYIHICILTVILDLFLIFYTGSQSSDYFLFLFFSDNFDSNSALENSLNAKEKQISELNMELHNIETALSNERDQHINEVKKLTAMLNEKVIFWLAKVYYRFPSCDTWMHYKWLWFVNTRPSPTVDALQLIY